MTVVPACARCGYPKAGDPRLVVDWLKVADEFLCDRCVKDLGVKEWRAYREGTAKGGRRIQIDYTNYRGERAARVIEPTGIRFGSNDYHTEPQWLLDAFDVEKGAGRSFAVADIHSWRPVETEQSADPA